MTILANILAWLARHALLFVLLVAAMAIYAQYRQSAASSAKLTTSIDRIESAQTTLRADIAQLKTRAVTSLTTTQRTSLAAIDQRLAAGLTCLTRIQGAPTDTTTVSATRDPFAEITLLTLPPGAPCVLQPRAIAGVVQPIAWLTWQLRFLVFHGPATIILTGGRGVRTEPAVSGRNIGQDQLIGFSAGLAYSTGRTETFLPYLLGQESLLKDRIAAGSGLLIAEESPRSSFPSPACGRGERRASGPGEGVPACADERPPPPQPPLNPAAD